MITLQRKYIAVQVDAMITLQCKSMLWLHCSASQCYDYITVQVNAIWRNEGCYIVFCHVPNHLIRICVHELEITLHLHWSPKVMFLIFSNTHDWMLLTKLIPFVWISSTNNTYFHSKKNPLPKVLNQFSNCFIKWLLITESKWSNFGEKHHHHWEVNYEDLTFTVLLDSPCLMIQMGNQYAQWKILSQQK